MSDATPTPTEGGQQVTVASQPGISAKEVAETVSQTLKAEKSKGFVKRLRTELESLKEKLAAAEGERDQLKQSAESGATDAKASAELQEKLDAAEKSREELQGRLKLERMRAAFHAEVAKLSPVEGASEDLFQLIRGKLDALDWDADESPVEGVVELLTEAKEAKPFFFAQPSNNGQAKPPAPKPPAPGGQKGTATPAPGKFSRSFIKQFYETPYGERDAEWKAQRRDIESAVRKGEVTND